MYERPARIGTLTHRLGPCKRASIKRTNYSTVPEPHLPLRRVIDEAIDGQRYLPAADIRFLWRIRGKLFSGSRPRPLEAKRTRGIHRRLYEERAA